jgi:hypothetical protein
VKLPRRLPGFLPPEEANAKTNHFGHEAEEKGEEGQQEGRQNELDQLLDVTLWGRVLVLERFRSRAESLGICLFSRNHLQKYYRFQTKQIYPNFAPPNTLPGFISFCLIVLFKVSTP